MDANLRDVGYGYGSCGCTLAHCLEYVGREWGTLREDQYRDLLDGYWEGERDYREYVKDMEMGHSVEPIDWEGVPF